VLSLKTCKNDSLGGIVLRNIDIALSRLQLGKIATPFTILKTGEFAIEGGDPIAFGWSESVQSLFNADRLQARVSKPIVALFYGDAGGEYGLA
jgi:hypothetical protein